MYHIKETSSHHLYDLKINSNPSLTSSISSSSRYSSSVILNKEIDSFDIIDSLDFDDVDDHILNQEILHQQREAHINELHNLEINYIQRLETIISTYSIPLRKNCIKSSSSSLSLLGLKKQACNEKDIQCLFSNVEIIHQLHKQYLDKFNERLSIWGPTQIISDVVQTLFPILQDQYQAYFNNYDTLIATLDKLSRYSPFKKFMDGINNGTTNLLSLLQAPIHYMQKLQEIFTMLMNSTSSMHPDYIGLLQCKTRFQYLMEDFKSKFEDIKNVDQVYKISQDMIGHPFRIKASRRLLLVNHHFIHLSKLSMAEDRVCILFNDILVLAKQKPTGLHYKGHINLHKAKVRSLSKDYAIEITCPFHGVDTALAPSIHVLRTFKKEEQLKWLSHLEATIARLDQYRLLHRDRSISDDSISISTSS